MKTWIAAILIVLVLVVVYILLPAEIAVEQKTSVKVNATGAYRNLAEQDNWVKWWPGENIKAGTKTPFSFGQYSYSLQQRFFQSLVIQVNGDDRQVGSNLTFIPLGVDYTIFQWQALVSGSPWKKIQTYLAAKRMQSQMEDILERLKEYMEKDENIYGFTAKLTRQNDSTLVVTRFKTTAYPETNEIYQYISQLKAYVAARGAAETNYPMLHVQQVDSNHFENMVAIPTNKSLQGNGDIVLKRMVQGNILEAEVLGGPATAQQAMMQLGNYMEDHKMTSPAIPFLLLVTDRSKENDTARWVTRIYYPVY